MIRKFATGVASCLMLLGGCATHEPTAPRQQTGALADDHRAQLAISDNSIASESMVVVIDDPRSERRRFGSSGAAYSARFDYAADPALKRWSARIAADHGLNIVNQWPLRSLGVHCFVIDRPAPGVLASLAQDHRVRWVQNLNTFALQDGSFTDPQSPYPSAPPRSTPDRPASTNRHSDATQSDASDNSPQEATPGDFSLVDQFLEDFQVRGEGISIAVIDTGADTAHPDLAHTRVRYHNFVDDGMRGHGETHGTAVLGIIAASPAALQSQVVGPASEARLHHLRACWQLDDGTGPGQCDTFTLALALEAAIAIRPDVLNLSLTGPEDPVLEALIERLTNGGTAVVAAWDDMRGPMHRFPRAQAGVAHVYGVENLPDPDLPDMVLFAPRHAVSLVPMAQYGLISGHSAAAPTITAMIACLMEQNPDASPAQVLSQLEGWLATQYTTREQLSVANVNRDAG